MFMNDNEILIRHQSLVDSLIKVYEIQHASEKEHEQNIQQALEQLK